MNTVTGKMKSDCPDDEILLSFSLQKVIWINAEAKITKFLFFAN